MTWTITALAVYATLWLSIAAHEIGHTLASIAYGRAIYEYRVGSGPAWKFRLFSTEFSLGLFPTSGHITHFVSLSWEKSVVISGAGPAMNLALVLALIAYGKLTPNPNDFWLIAMNINLLLGLLSLTPFSNSDGYSIRAAIRRQRAREKDFAEYMAREEAFKKKAVPLSPSTTQRHP